MVSLKSFVTSGKSTSDVLAELAAAVDSSGITPDLVCVFDCDHEDQPIFDFIRQRFRCRLPRRNVLQRVMNEAGGMGSIGLLLIEDPDGDMVRPPSDWMRMLQLRGARCTRRWRMPIAPESCRELIWIYQTRDRKKR